MLVAQAGCLDTKPNTQSGYLTIMYRKRILLKGLNTYVYMHFSLLPNRMLEQPISFFSNIVCSLDGSWICGCTVEFVIEYFYIIIICDQT